MIAVETFPRMTVFPGYLCREDTFGEWTVHTITYDDGVVRRTEPLVMRPDRESAEAYVLSLLAAPVDTHAWKEMAA